jgi:2-C-methyl-D-erythritol 4-phosphate cytidylyltransferase
MSIDWPEPYASRFVHESARMSSDTSLRASAVIVAAGDSTRMGAKVRKPFLQLGGRALLEHVCEAFARVAAVREIVIVAKPEDFARIARLRRSSSAFKKVRATIAGGEARTDSVRAGVAALETPGDVVVIHDAARPLVRPALIKSAIKVAERDGGALVAVPVRDTLKRSLDGERAGETVDRSSLWCAQTPQAFRFTVLRDVLALALSDAFVPTDDAALYERYVGPITLVPGEASNLKITTPEDLALAEAILAQRNQEKKR